MNGQAPYISFVVVGRNDNYGGNFLYRMQIFINSLMALWQRWKLCAELIIVEWNPPCDKLRLKEAIIWPKFMKQDSVRIIEVPSSIHYQLPNSDRISVFEYIAKNVGIRRAQGEYIIATNPDIIFTDALIKFLSKRKLSGKCFYRMDRYDVDIQDVSVDNIQELEDICQSCWFRVCKFSGNLNRDEYCKSKFKKFFNYIGHPRTTMSRILNRLKLMKITSGLHINTSGDFLLMRGASWHRLKGYPEIKTHSFIDGYLCFLAASLGLQQVILKDPLRIYHQEHDRLESLMRPLTDSHLYIERCRTMLKSKTPEIINEDSWGVGYEKLPEYPLSL